VGQPSTVPIDVGEEPVVLREGPIALEDIEHVLHSSPSGAVVSN